MTTPINFYGATSRLSRLPELDSTGGTTSSAAGGADFQGYLLKSLEQVNELDRQSQSLIAGAITGDDLTQAEIFTSVKKADLAFRTMLQIRNKLLDAYNELKDLKM
ncbi:MAG TPA: flagellar hook-basal body complex protein FliE [Planctomycetaceae bacterium]|jgi:flagellar hook-basal body complex protein FliE